MKLLEFLKKNFVTSLVSAITVDSYRRQVYSHKKELQNYKYQKNIEIEKLKDIQNQELKNIQELHEIDKNEITKELKAKMEATLSNHLKNKEASEETQQSLLELSHNYTKIDTKTKTIESKLTEVNSKLDNGKFEVEENLEFLTRLKNSYSNELLELKEQKSQHLQKILEIINQSDTKSNIFDFLSDLIENYQIIADQLGLEQLVAIFNIAGLIAILMTLINITTLLIGDFLIEKLNLETKYPIIAKYIRLKQKLNKGYLTFYIIFLYILILLFISGNIYMLVLKYFVY